MDSRTSWRVALALCLFCFGLVRGQFQLSFGNPTPARPTTPRPTLPGGYDPACKDAIDNCANYGSDSCLGQYRSWAEKNCEATCGFCKPLPTQPAPCLDKLNNCDTFEADACTNPDYKAWAMENCRRHCRYCTQSQLAVIDAFTTKATTIPPQLCVDKADCRMYGQDACSVDKYGTWGAENCPLFCGVCQGAATPPPLCVDKSADCAQYQSDLCTNAGFSFFVEENCRKFCGRCGIPTPKPLCKDAEPDCRFYQADICTNPAYTVWAEDHCRKFCNMCDDKGSPTQPPLKSTTPRIKTPPPLLTKPKTPPPLTKPPFFISPTMKTPPLMNH